jgi:hypothetical protein
MHKRLALFGLVVVAAAAVVAAAFASSAKIAAKPSVASAPTIGGTAQVGNTLTVDHGNWNGNQPLTYVYQWQRCDQNGSSCSSISGATATTYVLKAVDQGNTLRVRVTATNSDGSTNATTVPTAVVTAAAAPAPAPAATGCPSGGSSDSAVSVSDISSPARLQIASFVPSPSVIRGNSTSFSLRVGVSDTCGQTVSGALVYVTAVPFSQFNVPPEATTGSDGSATLTFNRESGFPAAKHQRLLVLFIRARKTGDPILAGITTSRLVSIPVSL